jgi:hypothetical protein
LVIQANVESARNGFAGGTGETPAASLAPLIGVDPRLDSGELATVGIFYAEPNRRRRSIRKNG